jgi:hypothetical protein
VAQPAGLKKAKRLGQQRLWLHRPFISRLRRCCLSFPRHHFEARCRRQRQPQALCTTYPKSILARLPPGYQLPLPGPPHQAAHHHSFSFPDSLLQSLGTQDTDIFLAEHLAVSHQPRRHGGNKITKVEMASPALAFGQSCVRPRLQRLRHLFSLDQVL